MITHTIQRVVVIGLVMLILASVIAAIAAVNTVPSSRTTDQNRAITANNLKPSSCSALNLTSIVVCYGSGDCNGTNASELILGNQYYNRIDASGGNDCIVGGDSDDDIDGQAGTDVCIGGPGYDSFGGGCETKIQ
jgi:hypothetical protein